MPILTAGEAYAFNEDLNRYQAKEIAADKRDNWVEVRVNDILENEYRPYKPEHIQEAISELDFTDACLLGGYVQAAIQLPENTAARINLGDFMVRLCTEYWTKMAEFQAQKEYDEGTW